MKPLFWKNIYGKRIVLCGPLARCIPILMEFSEDCGCEVLICDDEYIGKSFEDVIRSLQIPHPIRVRGRFISCKELYGYRDSYIILAGKTFFDKYCKNLGYTGLFDFYSAVPLLKRGFIKEDYFAYFNSLYRKQKNGLYLGGIELNLTKRCSLKCRDCSNLIQYYDHPERLDKDLVIRSLKNLLDAVDGISMLKLMGGEPLLEQEILAEILKLPELMDGSRVLGIQIISNGTILFNDELLAVLKKNPFAGVLLSNYGKISSREGEIKKQLTDHHIPFAEIGSDDKWLDYGDPREVCHNSDAAKKLFSKCRSKENCCTVLDGRLYSCPRAAHGAALGFYSDDNESVDLLNATQDREKFRETIKSFYYRDEPVEACLFCNNMCGKLIDRAVQSKT